AGVLVAERVGQRHAGLLGPLPLLDVEIGAAQAGRADADDDFERPRSTRLVDLVQGQGVVIGMQARGLHVPTSSSSVPRRERICRRDRQMLPFTSRLVRTSRAFRSHSVSSGAATGSPLGATNAAESGSQPIPN